MARFLGSIQGQRGEATRLGGAGSGLTAIAVSWSGGVRVHLFDRDGADWCRIELIKWRSAGTDAVLYIGPVSEIKRVGLTSHGQRAHHVTNKSKGG